MKSLKHKILFSLGLLTLMCSTPTVHAMERPGYGGPQVPALVQALRTLTTMLGIPTLSRMLQNVEDMALYDGKHFAISSMSSFLIILGFLNKYFPETLYKKFKGEKVIVVRKLKALIAALPTIYLLLKAGYKKGRKAWAHWQTPAQRDDIPTDLQRLAMRARGGNGQGTLVDLENLLANNMFSISLAGNDCVHGAQWPLSACHEPLFECVALVKSIFQNVSEQEILAALRRAFLSALAQSESALTAVQCDLGTSLVNAFAVNAELYDHLAKSVNLTSFRPQLFRFAQAARVSFDSAHPCTVFAFVDASIKHYAAEDAEDVKLWWRHFCRITLLKKILHDTSDATVFPTAFRVQDRFGNEPQEGPVIVPGGTIPGRGGAARQQHQQHGGAAGTLVPMQPQRVAAAYDHPYGGGGGYQQQLPTVLLSLINPLTGVTVLADMVTAQELMRRGWQQITQPGFAPQQSFGPRAPMAAGPRPLPAPQTWGQRALTFAGSINPFRGGGAPVVTELGPDDAGGNGNDGD